VDAETAVLAHDPLPEPAPPPAGLTLRELSTELDVRRSLAEAGDDDAMARHRAKGKLGARERIDLLLDPGSFEEIDLFVRHQAVGFGLEHRRPETDGVVTGWGTVFGQPVCVFSHDARVFGGALGEAYARKIVKVMDLAASIGAPLVGLNDGGGARIQEGVSALDGFGHIFKRNVALSGVVPQISVILGPCAGGAVYSPALTDFIFVVRDLSNLYITGPDVIASVTGEQVTHEELGGAHTHATRTGVAHVICESEEDCLEQVRYLLSLLPPNNGELPPAIPAEDPADRLTPELCDLVPADGTQCYDMRRLVAALVDDGDLFEIQAGFAANIVCGLARIGGMVAGIVANQPQVTAGVLDIDASEKAARFVRTCDAFNIPLVTLVDVPGFLPGTDQEHNGIIRRGAKLLYAYCEATVPRVSLVVRKAFGGAYIVMDSKATGCDLNLAWPSNEIAVMGAEGAARIVFRRELSSAADPAAKLAELSAEYKERLMHPLGAAERGWIDAVIAPADTRRVICRALTLLAAKREEHPRRKHANNPL
jgi:methylmalonyl-CoA decarboxylase subunit alpha